MIMPSQETAPHNNRGRSDDSTKKGGADS